MACHGCCEDLINDRYGVCTHKVFCKRDGKQIAIIREALATASSFFRTIFHESGSDGMSFCAERSRDDDDQRERPASKPNDNEDNDNYGRAQKKTRVELDPQVTGKRLDPMIVEVDFASDVMRQVHRYSLSRELSLDYNGQTDSQEKHALFCMELTRAADVFDLQKDFMDNLWRHVSAVLHRHPRMSLPLLRLSNDERYSNGGSAELLMAVIRRHFPVECLVGRRNNVAHCFTFEQMDHVLSVLDANVNWDPASDACRAVMSWLDDDVWANTKRTVCRVNSSALDIPERHRQARELLSKHVLLCCLPATQLITLRASNLVTDTDALRAHQVGAMCREWTCKHHPQDGCIPFTRPSPLPMSGMAKTWFFTIPPMERMISTWCIRVNRQPDLDDHERFPKMFSLGVRGCQSVFLVPLQFEDYDEDLTMMATPSVLRGYELLEEPLLVNCGDEVTFTLDLSGPTGVFAADTGKESKVLCDNVHDLKGGLGHQTDFYVPIMRCDEKDCFTLVRCWNSERKRGWKENVNLDPDSEDVLCDKRKYLPYEPYST